MEIREFDKKFQDLFTQLTEIAFEFVKRNKKEIDEIYIFSSMESGNFFYNVFYKINGKLVKLHKINTVSAQQYDLSSERTFALLKLGTEDLEAIAKLFKEDKREVPTILKMVYSPKTGKFINDISYELHYSNENQKTVTDVFNEWFVEMGGKI